MGQPQRPDDDFSGTKVRTVGAGRYELGRQLGRGGMAEVCMAHDVRLGRTVAVKTLRADLAQDPVARSRFGREAQNAASLNHPAIVSVYDTGEDRIGGELVPFIVMECVEGRTVRELLSAGAPIPQEQALRITEGVLEALEYSHRNGIIHRDIKPANVIITNSGAVKVMDFGIARALHSAATTMTQTGMVMGTPQYLSPEQALGRTVDARSDLYSSGCLLYELLALRPPFNGDTPLSVVYQHVQDEPRPPSASDPSVPAHLDAIALKALAKNPDDRYQTAEEMRMDIRRVLAGQAVNVSAATTRIPTQNQTTRQAWTTGAAAAAAAPTARLGAVPGPDGTTTGPVPRGPNTLSAHDGGTGALHTIDEHDRRRTKVFYAIVAAVVVAVIAGVTYAVLALTSPDKADGDNRNPGTTTGTSPGGATTDGGVPGVGTIPGTDDETSPTSTRTATATKTAGNGGQPATNTPSAPSTRPGSSSAAPSTAKSSAPPTSSGPPTSAPPTSASVPATPTLPTATGSAP